MDCVVCIRDESGEYYKNAYVTIVSLLENTNERIIVHVLHDDTITQGKKPLEDLCASYGQEIRFHRVPDMDPRTAEAVSRRFNLGATYRYYIQHFVHADKAVYLDCDIVVNTDIAKLFSIDMGERLFASSLDNVIYWKRGRLRKRYKKTVDWLKLRRETYINSGMLLINLKRLNELSQGRNLFVEKTLDAVHNGIPLYYPDMDVINSVGASRPDGVLVLEPRFNLWQKALHLGLDDLEDCIFHFVTEPEKHFYPAHLLYWKYYAKTPFAADMFTRMSQAYCSEGMEFVKYYELHSRRRRHAADLLKYGWWGMIKRGAGRRLGLRKAK